MQILKKYLQTFVNFLKMQIYKFIIDKLSTIFRLSSNSESGIVMKNLYTFNNFFQSFKKILGN